ncbi:nucleocapsid, partial [Seattle Prectang virus]
MDKTFSMRDALTSLKIEENDATRKEIEVSGLIPGSVINSDIKKDIIILGLTPESFVKEYAAVEFNFTDLCKTFATHCKDFLEDLSMTTQSQSLEFSAKILFEVGPYIRNEKKSKGDKAIRFRFPYIKDGKELSCHSVIVSTFRENVYNTKDNTDKVMVITFKQAGMLAMITFNKMINLAWNNGGSVLMTPLCGAVYSRESINDMAIELKMSENNVIMMINCSTTTGGQHLDESDLACAVVSMIATTKKVASKDIRNMMITKVIKQYSAKHKQYDSAKFAVLSKYALGGVPQGMDAETLIENFSNIQISEVNLRAKALAIKQAQASVSTDVLLAEKEQQ